MGRFFTFVIFLIFFFQKFCAQNKTFSVALFFQINETGLEQQYKKLDSLCTLMVDGDYKIDVRGYADFLSDNHYNQILSEKRAALVSLYLKKKTKMHQQILVESKGLGENNSKDNGAPFGDASQRRVDIFVSALQRDNSTQTENINRTKKKSNQPPENKINMLKVGESMEIEGLNFVPGRHIAMKSSMPALEKLVQTLKEHSDLKIELQGHICCITDGETDGYDYDSYDRNLSENRARAVYDYLVKNDIDADRLTYKGYGHAQPKVFPETTPEEEQTNRRVEVKVLK